MPSPRQVGQYDLIAPLGSGGMGVVWKGVHRHLGQTVAIKFLAPNHGTNPQSIARFYREMRAAGGVLHANLIRAVDAGEYDGQHILVMECVDGQTVRELLTQTGPLPTGAACEIVRQAACGVAAIAAAGMVHRDLKPSNLFLTREGVVKVLDLGLARFHIDTEDRELTTSQNLLGTIDYMAPEQSDDARRADIRSDLYSLGCTLFALLTGGTPFASLQLSSVESRLRAHREIAPPKIESLRPDIPAALSQLIDRLLAKNPAERFQSADELVQELAPLSSREELVPLALSISSMGDAKPTEPQTLASQRGSTVLESPPGLMRAPGTQPVGSETHRNRPTQDKISSPRESMRGRALALSISMLLLAAVVVWKWPNQHEPLDSPRRNAGVEPTTKITSDQADRKSAVGTVKPLNSIDFTQAARLEWHDLLEHQPVPVYWQDKEGLSRWQWIEKRGQLAVSNSDQGLLSLGQVNSLNYKLQLGIHQNGWSGGVGVFFQMHDWNPQNDDSAWQCKLLKISQSTIAVKGSQHRVELLRVKRILAGERRGELELMPVRSQPVNGIIGEVMVEMTVRQGRLVGVQINGTEIRPIVTALDEESPLSRDGGTFGVYCDGAAATVRKARLMLLNGNSD